MRRGCPTPRTVRDVELLLVSTRAWFKAGGLEISLGVLVALASLVSAGSAPWGGTSTDLLLLIPLMLAQRRTRAGVLLALLLLVLNPFLGLGMQLVSLYLSLIIVITAVRHNHLAWAALLSTSVVILGSWHAMNAVRGDPTASESVRIVGGWVVLSAVLWAVGLGVRAADRAAEARVTARFMADHAALATELHDSVCRELMLLSRYADLAVATGGASTEDLERMADRARAANQALREATRVLANGGRGAMASPVTFEDALAKGLEELTRLGFVVEEERPGIVRLPPDVDLAAGRIVAEALHNVVKHGNSRGPCRVEVEVTPANVAIIIVNTLGGTRGSGKGLGMGITGMQARAGAVGGSIQSKGVNGSWTCKISLPLSRREFG